MRLLTQHLHTKSLLWEGRYHQRAQRIKIASGDQPISKLEETAVS